MRQLFKLLYSLVPPCGCMVLFMGGAGIMVASSDPSRWMVVGVPMALIVACMLAVEKGCFTLPLRSRHGRILRLTGSPAEVGQRIAALVARDDHAEAGLQSAATSAGRGGCGILLAGVLALVWAILSDSHSPLAPVAAFAAAVLAVLTAACFIRAAALRAVHARHDLHDGKLDALRILIARLGVDVRPGAAASLEAALGEPRFSVRQTQGFGRLLEMYRDDWLDGRVRLADRTLVRVRATGHGRQRVKFKRKRKRTVERVSACRTGCEVALQLRVDDRHPVDLTALPSHLPPPFGFDRGQVRVLEVRGAQIEVRVRYPDTPCPTGDQLLHPLVWIYRGLNAMRTGDVIPGFAAPVAELLDLDDAQT